MRPSAARRGTGQSGSGDGGTGGAGSLPGYDGEALAKKGVVFVTYNYRLGPFGFYAHPELTKESGRKASGNYGVMDLAAALKWVQANIAAFGGDPGRVTLVGESAGAALESVLAGSKEGRGLYHRIIAQSASWSGVRMEKMMTLSEAEQAGRDAALKIGADTLADLADGPPPTDAQTATVEMDGGPVTIALRRSGAVG